MANTPPPRPAVVAWSRTQAAQSLAEWLHLLGPSEPHRYPKGTTLLQQGSPMRELCLVAEGIVHLDYLLPDGGTTLLALRYPGQWLEECAPALSLPSPVSAITLTSCLVYQFDAPALLRAEQRHPALAALCQRSLRADLQLQRLALAEMKVREPAERFLQLCRELAAVLGIVAPARGPLRLPMPLTGDQLADLLGFSSRQFKRVKKDLRTSRRLRVEAGRVFVLTSRRS